MDLTIASLSSPSLYSSSEGTGVGSAVVRLLSLPPVAKSLRRHSHSNQEILRGCQSPQ
jgi:hypothetical protein